MAFADRIPDYSARVEAVMDRWLPAPEDTPGSLHAAMRHAVFNGGKRLRPLLVYATGEVLDTPVDFLDPMAASVELVHCFSLIHDDLPCMDDDDLRRGQPTVHRAYGEATAVLAGDALQSLAMEGLAAGGAPHAAAALSILARATGSLGMAGGQALDLAFESARPSREALEEMSRLKTGALLVAAATMPATVHTEAPPRVSAALTSYATALGLAFQIRDDLLDIEGDTAALGKTAGADAARDKATWPARFGVPAARRRLDALHQEALAALADLPGDPEPLAWLAGRMIRRDS